MTYQRPALQNDPLVIGLVGGIASGKSTVASIFQSLGCYVIDFDAEVAQALDQPDVSRTLAQWWGPSIIRPDGSVDRAEVARIVFDDDAQRRRLESLIHPIVWRTRQQAIDEGITSCGQDVPAVVLDAPVLFEAGLNRECDSVIFIDSPDELRQARAQSTRNWETGELTRRERWQIPLAEKRDNSSHIIHNDTDLASLEAQVRKVFAMMCSADQADEV